MLTVTVNKPFTTLTLLIDCVPPRWFPALAASQILNWKLQVPLYAAPLRCNCPWYVQELFAGTPNAAIAKTRERTIEIAPRARLIGGMDLSGATELCFIIFVLLPMKATTRAKSDHPKRTEGIGEGSARALACWLRRLAATNFVPEEWGRVAEGKESSRWRGAIASTRGACAPQSPSLSSVKLHPAAVSLICMVAGSPSPQQISDLLATSGYWQSAQPDELAPLVYDELRQLAHRYMRGERPDHTLQTTALVNEAYLRLADQTNPHWQDRTHFFAVAARMMRHILVDYARGRQRAKRGAGGVKVELSDAAVVTETQAEQVVDLNDALERLAELDRRASQVVELKYFGGMNYDEIAEVLSVSAITVRRDWEFAKAWLHKELTTD